MRYVNPVHVIVAADMTADVTETVQTATTPGSGRRPVHQFTDVCFQAIWTGTPVGNFSLQASNDGVTWTTLASSTVAAGGAAGNYIWEYNRPVFDQIRFVYTHSSSSGTLDVWFTAKGAY